MGNILLAHFLFVPFSLVVFRSVAPPLLAQQHRMVSRRFPFVVLVLCEFGVFFFVRLGLFLPVFLFGPVFDPAVVAALLDPPGLRLWVVPFYLLCLEGHHQQQQQNQNKIYIYI